MWPQRDGQVKAMMLHFLACDPHSRTVTGQESGLFCKYLRFAISLVSWRITLQSNLENVGREERSAHCTLCAPLAGATAERRTAVTDQPQSS